MTPNHRDEAELADVSVREMAGLLKVLASAEELIQLVEGVDCLRWASPLGARFKDSDQWARFYVAVKDALETNAIVGAAGAGVVARPISRHTGMHRRKEAKQAEFEAWWHTNAFGDQYAEASAWHVWKAARSRHSPQAESSGGAAQLVSAAGPRHPLLRAIIECTRDDGKTRLLRLDRIRTLIFDAERVALDAPVEPSELEMHRADYKACKKAGFESPGELLSAYKTLLARSGEAERWGVLREFSRQQLPAEMDSYTFEHSDWAHAYGHMIYEARAFLARHDAKRKE